MSAELNSPESNVSIAAPASSSHESEGGSSAGPAVAGAPAPGKSRRRRRKRKHRPAGEAGTVPEVAASANGSSEGESNPAEAQAAPQQPRPQSQAQNQGANGHGQATGAKRWKKKKFGTAGGTERQARPEPGNSVQGSNAAQGRGRNRKQQPRGPRAFVGPMDHSYREANGNYAEGPSSTVEQSNGGRRQSNHRNHGHNEDRMPPELMTSHRAIAIPEDAPTHIYFFIEDLFFTAKIQEAARQQGVKVAFMKPDKDIVAHLAELHDHEHPSLIVFDLNNAAAKPLTLIPKLKNKLKKGTSIVGFLSHLQGDLKAKAVEAGCNSVMPRAAFSQNLPNLLRRYGVEDEHEPNFNQ